jgi:crossover junction endodeoxyribonuclease RusA
MSISAGLWTQLTLPYPPSTNTYWRHVGPKVLLSAGGRQYRKDVSALLVAFGCRPLAGELDLAIRLHPPDRRRRDADNTLKALLDSLQHGGLYEDDSQVKRIEVVMLSPVAGGCVDVTFRPFDAARFAEGRA